MYRAVKGAAKNNSEKQRTSQIYADSFATLVYCVFFSAEAEMLALSISKETARTNVHLPVAPYN